MTTQGPLSSSEPARCCTCLNWKGLDACIVHKPQFNQKSAGNPGCHLGAGRPGRLSRLSIALVTGFHGW